MRICYFGTYSKDYIRNRVIIKGLKLNGAEVVECHYPLWRGVEPRIGEFKGVKGIILLLFKFLRAYLNLLIMALEIKKKPEVLIVGYTGHFDIPLAYIVSKMWRVPLVFDFHVSLWDTFVMDRHLFKKGSIFEKILRFIDRFSLRCADMVFLDTRTHIDFVSREFKIPEKKFRRFWVGEDPDFFHPVTTEKFSIFTVIYFGGYIPLHGMEFIIDAAKRLEDKKVIFLFAGKGQLFEKTRKQAEGLRNVQFLGWVEPEKLPELISKSHITLGIFGTTNKAYRVIPNKLYEGIACRTPVITGETPAIKEIFTHKKNIYLCRMGDGESLAKAILELKKNRRLREGIGDEGYKLFLEMFTPEKIGREVLQELKTLKRRKV